jgi:hypothetical protein
MRHLYELERTINDELNRYTVDCDGDPDDCDFTAKMARTIYDAHIKPLVHALTEAAQACNEPNSHLCRLLNAAIAKAEGR